MERRIHHGINPPAEATTESIRPHLDATSLKAFTTDSSDDTSQGIPTMSSASFATSAELTEGSVLGNVLATWARTEGTNRTSL